MLPSSRKARKSAWRDSVESIGGAILLALCLRAFVFEAFKIPSGSMIPSLAVGDQIWVNKLRYGIRVPFTTHRLLSFAEPQRGEVLVFVCPEAPHEDYIKRVVGLPGDRVSVSDGQVRINGQLVPSQPLGQQTHWNWDAQGWHAFTAQAAEEQLGAHRFTVLHSDQAYVRQFHDRAAITIPEGHVFMMGDNRDQSHDSRAWGPVPFDHIIGRSTFVWWSWGNAGLRPERLGHWVP